MSSEEDKKNKEVFEGLGETFRDFAPFLTLGIQLAVAVVGFFFIGAWVDQKYGTAPTGSLVGVALGTVGGFWKFFRSVKDLTKQQDAHEPSHRDH